MKTKMEKAWVKKTCENCSLLQKYTSNLWISKYRKKILLKKKHKTNISFFLEQNFKFKRRCEENFRETFLFLSCLAKLKKNCKKCKKLESLKKKIALKFHFQNLVTVKKTHQFMFSYRGRRGLVCYELWPAIITKYAKTQRELQNKNIEFYLSISISIRTGTFLGAEKKISFCVIYSYLMFFNNYFKFFNVFLMCTFICFFFFGNYFKFKTK